MGKVYFCEGCPFTENATGALDTVCSGEARIRDNWAGDYSGQVGRITDEKGDMSRPIAVNAVNSLVALERVENCSGPVEEKRRKFLLFSATNVVCPALSRSELPTHVENFVRCSMRD